MGRNNARNLELNLPRGFNPKKDSSFVKWRTTIDELLESNKDFATQSNEIKRLILGEPIEEGFVQAKTIIGDLKSNEKN